MRKRALGLVIGLGAIVHSSSLAGAAYVPPSGYARAAGTFAADAFAVAPDGKVAVGTNNFSGGATVAIYANVAAAATAGSPLRVFTAPSYKSWGDLTFVGNDALLFSENGGAGSVYQGNIVTGATTPLGNVPSAAGVVAGAGGVVYATAATGPGANAIYQLSGGAATPLVNNIGTGYLGGIAVDQAGNLLVTDSNDPNPFDATPFAGRLLRYGSNQSFLGSIDLAGGGGTGAYDVVLDSDGDAFVTTGSTITRVPDATLAAEPFGGGFSAGAFLGALDFVGSGFEPGAGSGRLWINAAFADDGAVIGITPIPEPGAASLILAVAGALRLSRRRRRALATVALAANGRRCGAPTTIAAAALVVVAVSAVTAPARAEQFYASQVVSTVVGAQQQSGFKDPNLALGGPRGGGTSTNSLHAYSLGNGGSITLGFGDGSPSERTISDGPGADFIVSENSFYDGEDPHRAFAELMWVEVSSDGANFARFPAYSGTPQAVPAYGTLDPAQISQFAGVRPVLANIETEPETDPFDAAAAGGDAFELSALRCDPLVVGGQVDLGQIRYVRLVDVIGDGSSLDAAGRPVFDPTGFGIGGADVDALTVINGAHAPEPTAALPLAGLALARLARRRR